MRWKINILLNIKSGQKFQDLLNNIQSQRLNKMVLKSKYRISIELLLNGLNRLKKQLKILK
jgi:hypothetical protein